MEFFCLPLYTRVVSLFLLGSHRVQSLNLYHGTNYQAVLAKLFVKCLELDLIRKIIFNGLFTIDDLSIELSFHSC